MIVPVFRSGPALCALAVTSFLWACGPGGGRSAPAAPPGTDDAPIQAPSADIGLQLLRQGDLKGAEAQLAGALRGAPGDRRILEALGSIYARTDRWKQAEESFRAALRGEPASIGARLGLASVCIDTGRYDEASALLAEVRQRDPGNPVARLKGALLDARLGRAAEAEAGAREVIARLPANAEAHYVLGLALEQKGELQDAVGEMRRVHDLAPSHLGALSHLVTIETRLGRMDEADRWRKTQQEAQSRAHIEERVRDHRIKGVAAFNREDYRTALLEFQAIAREDPGDPQVHLHLGSTYIALDDLDAATRELKLCLSLDPRNDRGLAELGRAHAKANRLDEAIEALRKAIAINPQLAEPHYYLAGIYMSRGEQDQFQKEMTLFNDLQSRSQGAALEVQPRDRP
jgi:Flp pilus assembly protein TadD